jgi:hypothetical protein
VKGEPLVTSGFEARGVFVDPTIATLDTVEVVEVVEVVGLVSLDGAVLLEEEGADVELDEGVEEEDVVEVVVSEDLEVEDDSAEDEEDWVDEEADVDGVDDERGVELDDFDFEVTVGDCANVLGDCEPEKVGVGAELGVLEGVLEDWALK